MEIQIIPITGLNFQENNPKRHGKQIPEIAKLLLRFGWRQNVVVFNGVIKVGNGRIKACQYLIDNWDDELKRFEEFCMSEPCPDPSLLSRLSHLKENGPTEFELAPCSVFVGSQEEADSFLIAENESHDLSPYDNKAKTLHLQKIYEKKKSLDYIEIKPVKIERIAIKLSAQPIEFKPFKVEKVYCARGDLYHIGSNFVACGDCVDKDFVDRIVGHLSYFESGIDDNGKTIFGCPSVFISSDPIECNNEIMRYCRTLSLKPERVLTGVSTLTSPE